MCCDREARKLHFTPEGFAVAHLPNIPVRAVPADPPHSQHSSSIGEMGIPAPPPLERRTR